MITIIITTHNSIIRALIFGAFQRYIGFICFENACHNIGLMITKIKKLTGAQKRGDIKLTFGDDSSLIWHRFQNEMPFVFCAC